MAILYKHVLMCINTIVIRDCAVEDDVVLCKECFINSEHKNHDVIVWKSGGTGDYCDCGDPEAFSSYPDCYQH